MKTSIMKAVIFVALFVLSFDGFSQAFETTIDAPDFILPCSDTNAGKGLRVLEYNQTYVMLSEMQASVGFEGCVILGGIGYMISSVSLTGDTLFNEVFIHPDQELEGTGSFYPVDFSIAPDGSIYVVGIEERWGHPHEPVFIAKHDANGQLLWKQGYSLSYLNPRTILVDGGFIYVGGEKSVTNQYSEAAVLQLSLDGVVQWSGYVQTMGFTHVTEIVKRSSDYVLVGKQIVAGGGTNNYRPFFVPFTLSWIDTMHYFGDIANTYENVAAIYSYDQELVVAGNASLMNEVHLFEINDADQVTNFTPCSTGPLSNYYLTGVAQVADSNFVLVGETVYNDGFFSGYGRTILYKKFDDTGTLLIDTEYAGNARHAITNSQRNVVIAGARFDRDLSLRWSTNSLLMVLDDQGLTPDCSPHFVMTYYNYELSDSLGLGGIVHVLNNSEGEAANFSWVLDGVSGALTGHNVSYQVSGSGWLTLSLVGCGGIYTDSVFVVTGTSSLPSLSSSSIDIYPNPSADVFHLSNFSGQLEVYSADGKKMLEETIDSEGTIYANDWEPGVYVVVFSNGSLRVSERVVKL